ncbi:hypothetical protein ACTM97_08030 [Oliverpabstia intestinalis]|uniref:hypothetical protein n=1 Tax=Oliverpabstia intestinalis TaxID=2606633 RepID=UPI003F8CBB2A
MKKYQVMYYAGAAISLLVGLWHFTVILWGKKGVCRKPGGVLSLRLFAGSLDFPGGCGGDLSLPAGIRGVA